MPPPTGSAVCGEGKEGLAGRGVMLPSREEAAEGKNILSIQNSRSLLGKKKTH